MDLTIEQLDARIAEAEAAQMALDEQRRLQEKADSLKALKAEKERLAELERSNILLEDFCKNEAPARLKQTAEKLEKWRERLFNLAQDFEKLRAELPELQAVILDVSGNLERACVYKAELEKGLNVNGQSYTGGPTGLQTQFPERWAKVTNGLELNVLRDTLDKPLVNELVKLMQFRWVYLGPQSLKKQW